MKRIIYLLMVTFALSAIASCTSYNYYTAAINKTNMSGYHSFAWMPTASQGKNNMNNASSLADATIKDAATAALVQKGLRLNQQNPDLLVMYTTKVGLGTKTNYYTPYSNPWYGGFGFGYGFGWGWGWRYRPYYYYGAPYGYYGGLTYAEKEHYKEGTLIIDLIDTRTRRVVWRGFGVGDAHNTEKTIKDLPKVVDGIISQLNIAATYRFNGMRS
jgi:hypothetical protein